ncbi:nucleoporin Nup43-like [Branchiostoma lanceolatum]|uniref:nucleoporin Nup43-like n=1 Tax=Branchiostoma lanceolatum TaxID=7740 RepID=UPI003453A905
MAECIAEFVSEKVNKIRWRPQGPQALQQSDVFVSGSWDNEENRVRLWHLPDTPVKTEGAAANGQLPARAVEPRLVCEVPHQGDVKDLKFLDYDKILAASSTGNVTLYKHHHNSQTLSVGQTWDSLHHHNGKGCPCTGLAATLPDIVTVGEDGRINVVRVDHRAPIRTIDNADSCTLNAVSLKAFEVITVNSTGQLKVFDLRRPSSEPTRIFLLSGDRIPLHCLDKHPGQPHIVATGGQDGSLYMWDLRQERHPVSAMDAHAWDMWEVLFHPTHPDHLFSCSQDGSLWHWDVSMTTATPLAMATPTASTPFPSRMPATSQTQTSPWLLAKSGKQKVEVSNLLLDNIMSVNSLDIVGKSVVCGTDAEAIYVIRNINIR